ncbi:Putative diacyglycerol O-acyltransferase [Seminavis robusta]|uniref:Diacyglycerol O-acyltransferase n=1 Tax=Seminavis robusta TaxID=568900 RepID=A0A9N8HKK9_9STRA|nr:Putative diacyglycerol O-acyltransferase [Seminavis robusta]|eukprot:Sro740_g195580.1 Putative diacyglycerol O-acyltransferase (555) ;mRNA; r:31358-33196
MMDAHQCARNQLGKMVNISTEGGAVAFVDLWKCYDINPYHPYVSASLVSAVVVSFSIIFVAFRWKWRSSSVAKSSRPPLKRSVSNTSSLMASMCIPKRHNMPDPIINIFIEFAQCPTEEDMMNLVVAKLLQYERLATIPVVDQQEQLSFHQMPFDTQKLVRRILVNNNTKECEPLHKVAERHLHDPLDDPKGRGKLPWWEILLLDNQGTGNSACIWRIHHALGDGISLATVGQQILEYADGSPMTSVIPKGMMEKRGKPQMALPSLAGKLLTAAIQVLTMPHTWSDDPTVFSKAMGTNMVHNHDREIVLFPTLPLDFVKAIKNAAKVSINDVLFTCLSQAIRDYLDEQDCPVIKEQGANLLCRALIAAVLPRTVSNAAVDTLKNKWFFLSSDLGVGVSPDKNDILERLQYLHNHLSSLKTSPVPMVGLAMQNHLAPYTPRALSEYLFWNTLSKRSVSISNVPGPAKTCMFAGQPGIGCNMFLSNIMPHVAFISYAGQISGNITLDPSAVPNCQSLSRHLHNAVVTLAERLDVPVPKEVLLPPKVDGPGSNAEAQ